MSGKQQKLCFAGDSLAFKDNKFEFEGKTFIEVNYLRNMELVRTVTPEKQKWYQEHAAFPLLVDEGKRFRVDPLETKSRHLFWSVFQRVKLYDKNEKKYLEETYAICKLCNDGQLVPANNESLLYHLQYSAVPKTNGSDCNTTDNSAKGPSFIERASDGKRVKRLYLSDTNDARLSHEKRKMHWIIFEAVQKSKATDKQDQGGESRHLAPLAGMALKKEKLWEIDLANAVWVATDARSIRACLSSSFREREAHFLRVVSGGVLYTETSEYRLRVALVSLYHHVREYLESTIQKCLTSFRVANVPGVTLHTDGWKSSDKLLFWTRVYLLEPDRSPFPTFKPREFSLGASLLDGNQDSQLTSRIVGTRIHSLLRDFGIKCKKDDGFASDLLGSTTTDNGGHLSQELSILHAQVCIVHTLDNCLKQALGSPSTENSQLASFQRAFFNFISLLRSRKIGERLDRGAELEGIRRVVISKVSDTRWDAFFLAAVQALRMKPIIEEILGEIFASFCQPTWVVESSEKERTRWKSIAETWGTHFKTLGELVVPLREVFMTTQSLQGEQRNLGDAFIQVSRLRMQIWHWLNVLGVSYPPQLPHSQASSAMSAFTETSTPGSMLLEYITRGIDEELISIQRPLSQSEMSEVKKLSHDYKAKVEAMADVKRSLATLMERKRQATSPELIAQTEAEIGASREELIRLKAEKASLRDKLEEKKGFDLQGSAFHATTVAAGTSPELKEFLLKLAHELEKMFFGQDLRENAHFTATMASVGLCSQDKDKKNTSLLSPCVLASVLLDPVGGILLSEALGFHSPFVKGAIRFIMNCRRNQPEARHTAHVALQSTSDEEDSSVDEEEERFRRLKKRRRQFESSGDVHSQMYIPQHVGGNRFCEWDALNHYLQKVCTARNQWDNFAYDNERTLRIEFGEINELLKRCPTSMERMLDYWNRQSPSDLRSVALAIANFRCTSTSVERQASLAGLVDAKTRHRLSSKMFEILSFLCDNRQVLREISHDLSKVKKLSKKDVDAYLRAAGTRSQEISSANVRSGGNDLADEKEDNEREVGNSFCDSFVNDEEFDTEVASWEDEYVQTVQNMQEFPSSVDGFTLLSALIKQNKRQSLVNIFQ